MKSNYLVTKSNLLINSSYDLTLEEQKIILTLASFVEPGDADFKPYRFEIKSFLKLLGIRDQSKYRIIPSITKELMKKVFEIHEEDGTIIQLAWLSSAKYKTGTGYVELEFSNYLKPYMLFLKDFYTSYRLNNVLSLKSKYSIRMYEILKSNQFKSTHIITIEDIKKLFKLNKNNSYNLFSNLKSKVISMAQKEINQKTDIYFDFEEIKLGRKVDSIKFIIKENKNKSHLHSDIDLENIELLEPDVYPNNTCPKSNYLDSNEDIINTLKNRIEHLTKADIDYNYVKDLYKEFGLERIQYYLDNYHLFKVSKHNPVGFLIDAIKKGYSLPKEEINNYSQKPIQSTNFDQRKYDDEFFESLYDNFRK